MNRDHLDPILESISDGVFTVDEGWLITSFNRAAEQITGVDRHEAIGRRCCDVFHSNMCETACALRQTMKDGRPVIAKVGFIVDARGRRVPISISTALLRDASGAVVGGAETFRDLSEVEGLRKDLSERYSLGDLVSHNAAMRDLFSLARMAAGSSSTILIQGDTGTGKELLARAIHMASTRASGPFVAVNCGALPDELLGSELFGHVKGAFTGAFSDRIGRFESANGGTLFLDEIGDVSPSLQVRLLRVLQERQFEPIGSSQTRQADVRILAATNRDLAAMVASDQFREDLYYRINVIALRLPPLRDRREDIPLLVEHFVGRLNRRHARHVQGVSHEALSALMSHAWPGNVRELENAIERAFVVCSGDRLELGDLPDELMVLPVDSDQGTRMANARALAERLAIEHALTAHGGNRTEAARSLGIHKTTLYRRMHALGIQPPAADGRQRHKE